MQGQTTDKGTDQTLDAKRLTLMSGQCVERLLAGLLQWFGLPESAQLRRPDGTIVPAQSTMSLYRQVAQRASPWGA